MAGRGDWFFGVSAAGRLVAFALALCLVGTVHAKQSQVFQVHLPAQSVAAALHSLSEQTGVPVIFPYDLASSRDANPVTGRHTLEEAIALLLESTGLSGGLSDKGVLMISLAESEAPDDEGEAMGKNDTKRGLLVGLVAAVTGAFGAAEALGADVPGQLTGQQIEEIVVTAQKRAQSVQDVPISVAAFTGEMISAGGGVDITAINGLAPNIVLQTQGLVPNVPMFAIRGMNHSDPDPNSDPKISTVIDGVYVPFVAGALLDLFDLERVEILRGPQGTLFGKNNLAGTVSITTARPTGELGGSVRATVGDHGLRQYQARIDSPSFANDVLAARLSVSRRDYDGYTRNLTTGSRLNGGDVWAARGVLSFVPTDTIEGALIVDFVKEDVDGPCGHSLGVPEIEGRRFQCALSFDPFVETETYGITLQSDWDVGPGVVSLVAGHRKLEYLQRGDFDGLPNDPGLDVIRDFEGDYQSLELRFASEVGERFDYVVGLYYIQDDWKQVNDVVVNPVVSTLGLNQQEGESYAAFAQGDFHLSPSWTFTVGGRYTRDKKRYELDSRVFAAGNQISEFNVPASDSWTNFSPRVAVEFRPEEQIMLYGSISRGYKGGGYNSRATLADNVGPYDEETVTAYELGMKSDWLDGTLRANAALFFNRFKDLQISVSRQGAARTENITTNVAEVETYGAEVELTWLPVPNLRLALNMAYLSSEYSNFCDAVDGPVVEPFPSDCGGPITPVVVDGQTQFLVAEDQTHLDLANAPKYSGSISASYDIPLRTGVVTLHGDVRYTGTYNTWGRSNDPGFVRGSVALFNANVAYSDHADRFSVMLWGRNLTDKTVLSGAIRTGVNPLIQFYQPPRAVGATMTVNF